MNALRFPYGRFICEVEIRLGADLFSGLTTYHKSFLLLVILLIYHPTRRDTNFGVSRAYTLFGVLTYWRRRIDRKHRVCCCLPYDLFTTFWEINSAHVDFEFSYIHSCGDVDGTRFLLYSTLLLRHATKCVFLLHLQRAQNRLGERFSITDMAFWELWVRLFGV